MGDVVDAAHHSSPRQRGRTNMLNATSTPGEAMAAALETTTDAPTCVACNLTANHPRWPAVTARSVAECSAKIVVLVVAAAAMWITVIAMITLLSDGLHANWH
jgi:sirohydrochlorin ferrochelatase